MSEKKMREALKVLQNHPIHLMTVDKCMMK